MKLPLVDLCMQL